MAALNHPSIVAIYDVGGKGEWTPVLVTELAEGRNLKGPLPLEAACRTRLRCENRRIEQSWLTRSAVGGVPLGSVGLLLEMRAGHEWLL